MIPYQRYFPIRRENGKQITFKGLKGLRLSHRRLRKSAPCLRVKGLIALKCTFKGELDPLSGSISIYRRSISFSSQEECYHLSQQESEVGSNGGI